MLSFERIFLITLAVSITGGFSAVFAAFTQDRP
jgi:hypothetical protein